MGNIPKHVVIIADGNGRWAKQQEKPRWYGHQVAGSYAHMKPIVQAAQEAGVDYLTLWAFSTDNWKRPELEIKVVYDVIEKSLDAYLNDPDRQNFRAIGRREQILGSKYNIPQSLLEKIELAESQNSPDNKSCLVLAVNYGGRDEILRAMKKQREANDGNFSEDNFSNYLDTKGIPDVDLMIRTSEEQRTSGFMPWQLTPAELYFPKVLFPDFGPEHFYEALNWFAKRERRRGGLGPG